MIGVRKTGWQLDKEPFTEGAATPSQQTDRGLRLSMVKGHIGEGLAFVKLVSVQFQIVSYETFRTHSNDLCPFEILIHTTNWPDRINKGGEYTVYPFARMKIKLSNGCQGINHVYLSDVDC